LYKLVDGHEHAQTMRAHTAQRLRGNHGISVETDLMCPTN
jgi:hypothetical protein